MSMLKKYRLLAGLTQEEMAKKMGISKNGYRNYERGIRVMPPEVLYKFLKIRGEKEDLKLAGVLKEIYGF